MAHYSKRNRNKKQNNSPQEIRRTITNGQGVEKEVIIKAASPKELAVSRFQSKQISVGGLRIVGGQIDEEQKRALAYPEAYNTFNKMMYDSAVATGYDTKRKFIWNAMDKYKIKVGKSKSAKAKQAQEFIEHIFSNFEQSWYEICCHLTTYSKYGFSLMEMVPTKIKSGKYAGQTKIKRLAPISPRSIDYWVISENQDKIHGVVQSKAESSSSMLSFGGMDIVPIQNLDTALVDIPYNRLLHWAYNGECANPIGESQFKYCYVPWLEKTAIQDYECIGISKDMSGIISLTVPAEVMNKAALDPSGKEAAILEKMMTDAANITANEQAYIINPSDWHEDGKAPMYGVELKGIQGGGRNFNLNETIQRKRKEILDVFGLGFIALGENGGGSYAQAEAGTSFHGLMLEADIRFIEKPFNDKLIPTVLALNGFDLEVEDIPVFKIGNIDEKNADTVSKVLQRTAATNTLVRHKDMILQWMEDLGFDISLIEDLDQEELWRLMAFDPDNLTMQTRSGDGMAKGSGNGTSDNVAGKDNSTSNNENSMES